MNIANRIHSTIAADETGMEGKKIELKNRFDQLRPEVLQVLRRLHSIPTRFSAHT